MEDHQLTSRHDRKDAAVVLSGGYQTYSHT